MRYGNIALAIAGSAALCFAGERSVDRAKSSSRDVTVRVALDVPTEGFSAVKDARGRVMYTADVASLTGSDFVSVVKIGDRGDVSLAIEFDAAAAATMADLTERYLGAKLAMFIGDELVAAPAVRSVVRQGRVQLDGVSSSIADRLLAAIEGEMERAGGPLLTAVPRTREIGPGETVTIDVFARDLADVRGYQISIDAVGGRKGSLKFVDGQIDTARGDYVFEGLQSFQAADDSNQRLANALLDDGIATDGEVYLGSFILQASDDAGGLFDIVVRGGGDSVLLDSQRRAIKIRTKSTSPVEVR